ncbi:hypothetical protein DVJ83_06785 [Deinococcus wulumuqiensis]|uniref:Uncharacterized protein n=1 Tax=Deinococcus wulumuqiensis TaxID=980427 RepID=A0A345IGU4_9DEIO|nr:hypothetical protein DVJ83_06785 [Deinococcus wulumuqiensis]
MFWNAKSCASSLEQFSELRDARNSAPHHSILRPAQCFALAPLAKKTLRLFVKCSSENAVCPYHLPRSHIPFAMSYGPVGTGGLRPTYQ